VEARRRRADASGASWPSTIGFRAGKLAKGVAVDGGGLRFREAVATADAPHSCQRPATTPSARRRYGAAARHARPGAHVDGPGRSRGHPRIACESDWGCFQRARPAQIRVFGAASISSSSHRANYGRRVPGRDGSWPMVLARRSADWSGRRSRLSPTFDGGGCGRRDAEPAQRTLARVALTGALPDAERTADITAWGIRTT